VTWLYSQVEKTFDYHLFNWNLLGEIKSKKSV